MPRKVISRSGNSSVFLVFWETWTLISIVAILLIFLPALEGYPPPRVGMFLFLFCVSRLSIVVFFLQCLRLSNILFSNMYVFKILYISSLLFYVFGFCLRVCLHCVHEVLLGTREDDGSLESCLVGWVLNLGPQEELLNHHPSGSTVLRMSLNINWKAVCNV